MVLAGTLSAQTSNTDGTTPAGLSPGAPAGSYSLTGFESVNLYNGTLNASLPLLQVRGRGEASYSIALAIEQKWRVERLAEPFPGQPPIYTPVGTWWGELKPGYGPGVLEGRRGGYSGWAEQDYCGQSASQFHQYMLTRLTFTAADGTEFELHDQLTGGQPAYLDNVPCASNGNSRGTVFVTADGTSATFISDTPIYDWKWNPMGPNDQFRPSGYLWLRNGIRYRIANGLVDWLQDRNGNRLTFTYSNTQVVTVTDSLNRQVTITYASGGIVYDQIFFKGFGQQQRSIKIWKASLGTVLRSGYSLQTYAQLFPDFNGASSYTQFNPQKVSAVELPDGRSYQFRYNSYGELARVELPTGGSMEYDWIDANSVQNEGVIYRRVSERRVYKEGATLENKITYSNPGLGQGVEVRTRDNAGALLVYSKHYHCGSALDSLSSEYTTPVSYPLNAAEGRELQTEAFHTDGTVLRRTLNTWLADGTLGGPHINPRIIETVTTIEPTGANLVSKQTFAHDQYNNVTDTYEYDFGSGGPGALKRRTHTGYVTASNYVSANTNPSLGAHLRSLPAERWVSSDAGGASKAALTVYEYDNYTDDSRHKPLVPRSGITNHDATYSTAFLVRGNNTGVTSYINAAAQTGPVTVSSQYDVAGNVVATIDGKGNQTSLAYLDSFCNGTTCSGTFTPNTFAFVTSTTSAVPDPTGQYGSTTSLVTSENFHAKLTP